MHIKQKVRDKRGKNPLFSRLGERTDIINNDNRQARLPPDIWRCNLVQKKLFLRAFSAFFFSFFRESRASLVSLRRSTTRNFSERGKGFNAKGAAADMLHAREGKYSAISRRKLQPIYGTKKGEIGAAWQQKGKIHGTAIELLKAEGKFGSKWRGGKRRVSAAKTEAEGGVRLKGGKGR